MTWETLSAIIAIVSCLVTLGGVLAKLVKTLTSLDDTIKQVKTELIEQKGSNKESHKRIYNQLEDHERRIVDLEHENK